MKMWQLNPGAAEFRPAAAADPLIKPGTPVISVTDSTTKPANLASTSKDGHIPLNSAIAFTVLEKNLCDHAMMQEQLAEIRCGFWTVDQERQKLSERIAQLESDLRIHKQSSAKLGTRATFERVEKEITSSSGD